MIRTMVVGLGKCHADALMRHPEVELVGLVNRSAFGMDAAFDIIPRFLDFYLALKMLKPDLVCIASYSETHTDYAMASMNYGAHVFVEKPMSTNIKDAEQSDTDNLEGHTSVGALKVHRLNGDEIIQLKEEPTHQELCDLEQKFMIDSIKNNTDLTHHMGDALQSLKICLPADESIQTGTRIKIKDTL